MRPCPDVKHTNGDEAKPAASMLSWGSGAVGAGPAPPSSSAPSAASTPPPRRSSVDSSAASSAGMLSHMPRSACTAPAGRACSRMTCVSSCCVAQGWRKGGRNVIDPGSCRRAAPRPNRFAHYNVRRSSLRTSVLSSVRDAVASVRSAETGPDPRVPLLALFWRARSLQQRRRSMVGNGLKGGEGKAWEGWAAQLLLPAQVSVPSPSAVARWGHYTRVHGRCEIS